MQENLDHVNICDKQRTMFDNEVTRLNQVMLQLFHYATHRLLCQLSPLWIGLNLTRTGSIF